MSNDGYQIVIDKLNQYKRKFYLNTVLKGLIFTFSVVWCTYFLVAALEYYGHFSSPIRFTFLVVFFSLVGFAFVFWILDPVLHLIKLKNQISDEEAAKNLAMHFPEMADKLLNTIQLKNSGDTSNMLLQASLVQRSGELSYVPFTEAIKYRENRKYLRLIYIPLGAGLIVALLYPRFFAESTERIIKYDQTFAPQAPFEFVSNNKNNRVFRNDDYTISFQLKGNAIPSEAYVILDDKRIRLTADEQGIFQYSIPQIQNTTSYMLEAAGFNSPEYTVEVVNRPDLKSFTVLVEYPGYLNKKSEELTNAGNISVPEGTKLTWNFGTLDADEMALRFTSDADAVVLKPENNKAQYKRKATKTEDYTLKLKNNFAENRDEIRYTLQVIPDQFPAIVAEKYVDTALFSYISLAGKISDDYGLTTLKLFYRTNPKASYQSLKIPMDQNSKLQNFYYNWMVDSLLTEPGTKLEYYLQVWDNDGYHGPKSTKSTVFEFKLPTEEEIKKEIETATSGTQTTMENLMQKTKRLHQDIDRLQNKLKSMKQPSWQEKKDLESILKKQEEIKNEINELSEKQKQLNEQKNKFSDMDEQQMQQLAELQQLMNQLMDDETKKLMEELQKMMEEKMDKDKLDQLLEKMDKKDADLNKDLERTLELFKKMQFEQKLEETIKDLDKLSEKQEKLSEETPKEKDNQKNQDEQEKLNKEFEKVKEELKKLDEINKTLQEKKDLESTQEEQKSISEKQQQSMKEMQGGNKQKASKSQKDAANDMKKLSQKMSQMQQQMMEAEAEENMQDLRAILENLLKLSFDQETLMKDFKSVSQTDPRYIQLGQQQLKLKDDSKIIEDSLMSLAKRVLQIRSFVTKELRTMKGYMDESAEQIKLRRPDMAAGKQQFAMTSMNNLALMLNDVLKQMQDQMNENQSNKTGASMCKKPGKNKNPGLGDMQKSLNKQIEDLKKGGKSGKQLSEELAKLSAQQERIRRMLQEMEKMGKNKNGSQAGNELSELKKLMEKTEKDLVNKNINPETLKRQQDILSRLLESEKAVRERELDEKRESETGKDKPVTVPPSFDKYLKMKEKQTELLKTIPPSLNPYYKQEVNEYFQMLEN